ncbi:MAG: stress response translation initiation inhibitor YciH [Thermoplasmata archaeon]|nr:stress response translation initiation inhibitor YciH [Thermoplasmata archaeon]
MAICATCGLPEEICICEEIAKETQRIRITSDRRRYGKIVTIVEGLDAGDVDLDDLARKLKHWVAAGGTVKDGRIELQGEHRKKVEQKLQNMGYHVEIT